MRLFVSEIVCRRLVGVVIVIVINWLSLIAAGQLTESSAHSFINTHFINCALTLV